MIIKEEKFDGNRLIWYKRKDTTYLIKIDEENEYTFIGKLKEKPKKKIILPINTIVASLLFLYLNKTTVQLGIENPEYIKNMIEWENLEDNEKEIMLLQQIEEQLNRNPNIKETHKEILTNCYEEYLPEVIPYFTRTLYWDTLESSRFVDSEVLEEPILKDNGLLTCGWYNKLSKTFYTIEDENTLFHEKLHADYDWYYCGVKSIYDEMHSSFGTKESYSVIRAAFTLLGELIGPDKISESLIKKEPKIIWKNLKKEFPDSVKEINQLEPLIIKIYQKEYKANERATEEINMFWNIYEKLYQEKYQRSTDEDIITSFQKDIIYSKTSLKNSNKLEYDETYFIGGIEVSLENRYENYKESIIRAILTNPKKNPQFYNLWITINANWLQNNDFSYVSFENALSPYLKEEEIEKLFLKMVNSKNAEQMKNCYDIVYEKVILKEAILQRQMLQ